jgi:hypothetical protein
MLGNGKNNEPRQTKEILIQKLRSHSGYNSSGNGDPKFEEHFWKFVKVTSVDIRKKININYGRLMSISRPNRDDIRTITIYAKRDHEIFRWQFYSHVFLDSLDGFKLEVDHTSQTRDNMIQAFLQLRKRFPQEVFNNIHKFIETDYLQIL